MMKQLMVVIPAVALVALFVPALSVSAQADPVSILQQFVDARNQADETGAMALVADDMRYVGGAACLLAKPCLGTKGIQADVQLFISDHAQSTLLGSPSLSGTTVTARVERSDDAVRAAGVDRIVSEYTVDVLDGKLTTFRDVQDASDPQTATFKAFERAQQPNAGVAPQAAPAVLPKDPNVMCEPDWTINHSCSAALPPVVYELTISGSRCSLMPVDSVPAVRPPNHFYGSGPDMAEAYAQLCPGAPR
jgi:hypothetical protein